MAIKTHLIDSNQAEYTAEEFSTIQTLLMNEGVLNFNGNSTDWKVVERGAGANMSVDIGLGAAFVSYLKNGVTWTVAVRNNAVINKAISSNISGANRVDAVVIHLKQTEANQLKNNVGEVLVVTGSSPSALSDSAINTAVGDTNWYRLANVTVPNAAVSIVTANIADVRNLLTIGPFKIVQADEIQAGLSANGVLINSETWAIDKSIDFTNRTIKPPVPATGHWRLYFKAAGAFIEDELGNEYQLTVASSFYIGGDGSDGPLNIGAGVTTTLNLNQVYNFSAITINATGILAFTGTGIALVNCSTNAVIAGTIELRGLILSNNSVRNGVFTNKSIFINSGNPGVPTAPNIGGAAGLHGDNGGFDGGSGGTSTTASGTPGQGGISGGGIGSNGSGGNSVGGGGGGGAANVAGSNAVGNNGGVGAIANQTSSGGGGGGGGFNTGNGGNGGAGSVGGAGSGGGGGGHGGASGANGGNGGSGGACGVTTINAGGFVTTLRSGGNGGWGYAQGGNGGAGGSFGSGFSNTSNGGNGGDSTYGNGGNGGAGGNATNGGNAGRGGNGGSGRIGGNGGNGGSGTNVGASNNNGGDGGRGGDGRVGATGLIINVFGTINFSGTINAHGGNGGNGGNGGAGAVNANGNNQQNYGGQGGNGGDGGDGGDVFIASIGVITNTGTINNQGGTGGNGGLGGGGFGAGTHGANGSPGRRGNDGLIVISQVKNM